MTRLSKHQILLIHDQIFVGILHGLYKSYINGIIPSLTLKMEKVRVKNPIRYEGFLRQYVMTPHL